LEAGFVLAGHGAMVVGVGLFRTRVSGLMEAEVGSVDCVVWGGSNGGRGFNKERWMTDGGSDAGRGRIMKGKGEGRDC
jgi:hypothetical protein